MTIHVEDRSARQVSVLALASRGVPTWSMAKMLGWSERTIKADVRAFCEEHGLANRTHAVAFALREGLIE